MATGISLQDLRAVFFLMISVIFLAVICLLAACSTVTRPVRWCERRRRRAE